MNTWTEEELELVKLWSAEGWTAKDIAAELNRTEKSIVHKRQKLGIVIKKQYTKDELIKILQSAKSTNAEYFMEQKDLPSVNTYQRHFGTWNNALREAGLPLNSAYLDPDKATIFYVVQFPEFYKIGITQSTVEKRFSGKQYPEFSLIYKHLTSLEKAKSLESNMLKYLEPYQYSPNNFAGFTECFKMSEYEFDIFMDTVYNNIFNSAETN